MNKTQKRKVALTAVVSLFVLSLAVPYLIKRRIMQEVWSFDDTTGNKYLLLAKISDKNGGIYGATKNLESRELARHATPFCKSKECLLFVKEVNNLTMPEQGDYRWVHIDALNQAVRMAASEQNFRDVYVESHDGGRIVVDDMLLKMLEHAELKN